MSTFDVDKFARNFVDRSWNQRDSSGFSELLHADFVFQGSTCRKLQEVDAYREYLDTFYRTFPNLSFAIDEVYWMGNETDGYLVSIRFHGEGSHRGDALYGEPTGKRVQIWGITQHEIRSGRIRREWTLFNELDVMMQIAAARRV